MLFVRPVAGGGAAFAVKKGRRREGSRRRHLQVLARNFLEGRGVAVKADRESVGSAAGDRNAVTGSVGPGGKVLHDGVQSVVDSGPVPDLQRYGVSGFERHYSVPHS